jgi:hypothetical protein
LGERQFTCGHSQLRSEQSSWPECRTQFGRWFGADGEPWCAIFLSYCFKVGAGVVLCGGVDGAGVTPNGCAYVPTLERWLRDTAHWVAKPTAGDIAIFNWDGGPADHAGIVERNLGDGSFASIEGNSDGRVARREHEIPAAVGSDGYAATWSPTTELHLSEQ